MGSFAGDSPPVLLGGVEKFVAGSRVVPLGDGGRDGGASPVIVCEGADELNTQKERFREERPLLGNPLPGFRTSADVEKRLDFALQSPLVGQAVAAVGPALDS